MRIRVNLDLGEIKTKYSKYGRDVPFDGLDFILKVQNVQQNMFYNFQSFYG